MPAHPGHALVLQRGWLRLRYQRWLIDTLTHALLPPNPATNPAPNGAAAT
jgi:hypothetical protein